MAVGYGLALKAIAGGVSGYLGGEAQNDTRDGIFAAYAHLPQAPDLKDAYLDGYNEQLKRTPELLEMDHQLRAKYLPQELQQAASLYAGYLPQFAATNLSTLKQVDPQFLQGRAQLFKTVSDDLSHGSELDPAYRQELTDYVRGGEAARGNVLGNAPIAAEALYTGQAGQALKQQRIGNLEKFLSGPTPEDHFSSLAGGGAGALGTALAAASHPGYSFVEAPHDWAGAFQQAAQTQWSDENTQALAKAKAEAAAPPETNPWLDSFSAGLNGLADAAGGGGGGGKQGGGMGSVSSWF